MFESYMGLPTFRDEEARRTQLLIIRRAAAMSGYSGRISFQHYGIHGRSHGGVRVMIHPRRH